MASNVTALFRLRFALRQQRTAQKSMSTQSNAWMKGVAESRNEISFDIRQNTTNSSPIGDIRFLPDLSQGVGLLPVRVAPVASMSTLPLLFVLFPVDLQKAITPAGA